MKYSFGLLIKTEKDSDSFRRKTEEIENLFRWDLGSPDYTIDHVESNRFVAYFRSDIEIDNSKIFFHDVLSQFQDIFEYSQVKMGPCLEVVNNQRAYVIYNNQLPEKFLPELSLVQVFLNPCL